MFEPVNQNKHEFYFATKEKQQILMINTISYIKKCKKIIFIFLFYFLKHYYYLIFLMPYLYAPVFLLFKLKKLTLEKAMFAKNTHSMNKARK